MDVRLSPEQEALRDSAAQIVDRLGPRSVAELDDPERADKLEAAVASAGWRELRVAEAGGASLASGVEAAIVAEELGRRLADAPFLGPTLAAELRRLAGAPAATAPETVALDPTLAALAVTSGRCRPLRCPGRGRRGSASALLLVPAGAGHRLAQVPLSAAELRTDLTRPVAGPRSSTAIVPDASTGRSLTADDLRTWLALGLAVTCADLVGTMRGAIELAVEYARSRQQFGRSIGSFQAVQHLLADAYVLAEGSASVARHAAWAVDALPADDGPGRGRGGQGLLRPGGPRRVRDLDPGARRDRQHLGVPGPRPPPSGALLRPAPRRGRAPTSNGCSATTGSEETMDFGDSPEEAAFRLRLRRWLEENDPGLPASSTDDAYWAGQAAWHRSLYDGGFFGTTWPPEIGGQGLPSVYDVIVDEELAAAGSPPRPSLGYLVEGILEHGSDDIRQRFLPGIVNGRDRWCQGFSEPDAGSDLASLRTRADRDGDDYVLTRSQGVDELLGRRRLVSGPGPHRSRRRQAQGNLRLRRPHAPGWDRAAAPAHDQRDHQGVRRGPLRWGAGAGRQHDRRPGRGLGTGHDRGQPRAGAA